MAALDEKNLRLLKALKRNARASLGALARDIDLSRSATHERIVKLEEMGVIKGYTIRTDPKALPKVRAFITLTFDPRADDSLAVTDIHAMEGVEAAYCLAGDVDMLVYCECETSEELSALRNRLASHKAVVEISTRHVLTSSQS